MKYKIVLYSLGIVALCLTIKAWSSNVKNPEAAKAVDVEFSQGDVAPSIFFGCGEWIATYSRTDDVIRGGIESHGQPLIEISLSDALDLGYQDMFIGVGGESASCTVQDEEPYYSEECEEFNQLIESNTLCDSTISLADLFSYMRAYWMPALDNWIDGPIPPSELPQNSFGTGAPIDSSRANPNRGISSEHMEAEVWCPPGEQGIVPYCDCEDVSDCHECCADIFQCTPGFGDPIDNLTCCVFNCSASMCKCLCKGKAMWRCSFRDSACIFLCALGF